MSRITSISEWLLRQAVVWGGLAYLVFYACVVHGSGENSFVQRYFNGYWIENVTMALFCVGMATLVIKWLGLTIQIGALQQTNLPAAPTGGQKVEAVDGLLDELNQGSSNLQEGYLVRRFRHALQFVQQRGSADTLEEHLRYLQDGDLGRMHQSYASLRIIASTIPILGFLGTVIGITMAIAKLSGEQMEQSLPQVISGLSVAFDTTALALALSMILLFAKFLVERIEVSLLSQVDDKADEQLLGRFRQYGSSNDPHLASVKRMTEQLLSAVETASDQQVDLLNDSLKQANDKWAAMADDMAATVSKALATGLSRGLKTHSTSLNDGVAHFAEQLEHTLIRHAEIFNEGLDQHSNVMNDGMKQHAGVINSGVLKLNNVVEQGATQYVTALSESFEKHTESLIAAEQRLADENRQHLSDVEGVLGEAALLTASRQEQVVASSEALLREMQAAIVESSGITVAQQQQLIKQGEVLLQVVEATGQVRKLEEALNDNLSALAGSHHFEQTVAGLAAALQMISARLGQPLPRMAEVALKGREADESQEGAAPASYAA